MDLVSEAKSYGRHQQRIRRVNDPAETATYDHRETMPH